MDSLKRKDGYRYDSFLKGRPLLMDSILQLEQIYIHKNKNEAYEK